LRTANKTARRHEYFLHPRQTGKEFAIVVQVVHLAFPIHPDAAAFAISRLKRSVSESDERHLIVGVPHRRLRPPFQANYSTSTVSFCNPAKPILLSPVPPGLQFGVCTTASANDVRYYYARLGATELPGASHCLYHSTSTTGGATATKGWLSRS